jgi:serine/threonine protein kinase
MLDFGIAKHKYSPKLTQEGFVVGTTEYMSPEQFNQLVEKKSDIWSLGVLTYELVTGYMPFEANNPVTLMSKIGKGSFTNPKILVPDISEKIITIIDKTLRINPSGRASAKEIRILLEGKPDQINIKKENTGRGFNRQKILLPAMIITGAVIFFLILRSLFSPSTGPVVPEKPEEKIIVPVTSSGIVRKIKINVPGIENAVLLFPDGSKQTEPYEITGNDGDKISFIIQAAGYQNKEVQFDLKMGPRTYDFILEKIKPE